MEVLDRLRIYDYQESKTVHFPELIQDYELMEESRKELSRKRRARRAAAKRFKSEEEQRLQPALRIYNGNDYG